ncbi:hypothetical protein PI95_004010 [Hassallia byssoidea VB512170]|uniref:Uncharacterized protein n=1 Tax=Hassallia byssoidea VB512170 TaxID=1304833 RepID=A0A846H215_9CYAN|nr:hypothetical protein [Hassalia byssoidea]NEU71767.1 hypothetical protein [Hassalia byssoidea VB512170]
MDNLWSLQVVKFEQNSIRLLNIDTGVEFFAEDIFVLVCPVASVSDIATYIADLPPKLRRRRYVQSENNEIREVDTLCWLALKYIFNIFAYQRQREFVRWLRKDIAKKFGDRQKCNLVKSKSATHSSGLELVVTKLNSLHWFNSVNNTQLDALSTMYLQSEFSFFSAPPMLLPAIKMYSDNTNLSSNSDKSITQTTYLNFLYKKVDIPQLTATVEVNLFNQLSRKCYLSCCQLILENENISYYDLYQSFVRNANDLLLAQELDVTIVFHYSAKALPFSICNVLKGGIFLQALELCGTHQIFDIQAVLNFKLAYLTWLMKLANKILVLV